MKNDKQLLSDLNDQLDTIKNKLGKKGKQVCEKELYRLRGLFNLVANRFQSEKRGVYSRQDESPFLEIMLTLKNIMKGIDDEGRLLEKEMHGVDNYSDYEYSNVTNFAFKEELKEELIKMLVIIRKERPELRRKEPFISI